MKENPLGGTLMQVIQTQTITPNIEVEWGDGNIIFSFNAKKNIRNRVKFWILCFFFPYHIKRWESVREKK